MRLLFNSDSILATYRLINAFASGTFPKLICFCLRFFFFFFLIF